jgi:hypothetical protein
MIDEAVSNICTHLFPFIAAINLAEKQSIFPAFFIFSRKRFLEEDLLRQWQTSLIQSLVSTKYRQP